MINFSNEWTDVALLVLRIAIGASFLFHGLQKRSMWKMQPSKEMPAGMQNIFKLLSVVEPLGGVAIILGFLTQFAAIGFIIIMLGAINTKISQMKKKFGDPGGWEVDALLLAANIAILLMGAGQFSIDALL